MGLQLLAILFGVIPANSRMLAKYLTARKLELDLTFGGRVLELALFSLVDEFNILIFHLLARVTVRERNTNTRDCWGLHFLNWIWSRNHGSIKDINTHIWTNHTLLKTPHFPFHRQCCSDVFEKSWFIINECHQQSASIWAVCTTTSVPGPTS